ncbi:MAG TPA: U32 family peptidase, partial [Methanomicrobiales archaeon]|nr:U32 family peptidase [Methanomicrobiales archaeon]
ETSLSCYTDTLDTVQAAAEGGCRRIYYEPAISRTCGGGALASRRTGGEDAGPLLEALRQAADLAASADTELVWKWPRITRQRFLDAVLPLLPQVYEAGVHGVMVEGIGLAEAVIAAEPRMSVSGGSGLNVWNHCTAERLSPPMERLTLSPELSMDAIRDLVQILHDRGKTISLEMLVQGNLEAMVTEDCIPCTAGTVISGSGSESWTIRDERDRQFPLLLDAECRTHIFNAVELCLLDHMPNLSTLGLSGIAIDARGRTALYAREMTGLYKWAIECTTKKAPGWRDTLLSMKDEAKKISLGGITTGHFLRGLKEEE